MLIGGGNYIGGGAGAGAPPQMQFHYKLNSVFHLIDKQKNQLNSIFNSIIQKPIMII